MRHKCVHFVLQFSTNKESRFEQGDELTTLIYNENTQLEFVDVKQAAIMKKESS